MILIKFKEKIKNVDEKIPSTNNLVKKTDYDTNTITIEDKIPSSAGLVTTAALDCPISQEVKAIKDEIRYVSGI